MMEALRAVLRCVFDSLGDSGWCLIADAIDRQAYRRFAVKISYLVIVFIAIGDARKFTKS